MDKLNFDQTKIDALAAELMEPQRLADGGPPDVPPRSKIAKAAAAVQAARSIGDEPLEGAPTRANVPNVGEVRLGKNREAEEAARRASAMSGVPYRPTTRFAPLDVDRATRIAREYDLMKHDPDDPLVKLAYEQMIKETNDQYEAMLQAGIEPYFIEPGSNTYRNSPYEVLLDVAENRRLGVFPSVEGFGTDPNFNPQGNPLLQETGRLISGRPALANDLFRAVHDYFGHAKPGVGFRAAGEENAYQSHAGMFSPLARRALASETRGQNSYLNYGPYGETNRTARIEDTRFADQKAGLMPRWASEAGLVINDDRRREFFDNLARNQTGLEGAISDDGKLRLVHYSSRPLERIDPAFYGRGLSRASLAERNRSYDPEFVKRSYYGIPASENPYVPEFGLGGIRNEVLIEPELIYQAQANPEGLWLRNDPTGSERRIAEAGYTGYYTTDPKLGKVAVIFDPYDVSKSYMIPVGAVGAGAMAMSGEDELEKMAGGGAIRRLAEALKKKPVDEAIKDLSGRNEIDVYETYGDDAIEQGWSDGSNVIVLDKIYIDPENRGQGIGRQILSKKIEELAEQYPGYDLKLLAEPLDESTHLDKLIEFYESMGFDVGDYQDGMSGVPMEMTLRSKPKQLAGGGAIRKAAAAVHKAADAIRKDDAGEPLSAINEDYFQNVLDQYGDFQRFGLRVIPRGYEVKIGDTLPVSKDWDDNIDTGVELEGTSAIGLDEGSVDWAIKQLLEAGYDGDQIVLIGGNNKGYGNDKGEVLISNARVIKDFSRPEKLAKGGLVDKLRSAASSVKEAGNVYKAAVGNMFSPFEPTEPQLGDPNDYELPELRLRRPGIVNLALGMPNMFSDMRYLFGAVKDAATGDEVPDEQWPTFDIATEAQGRYEDDMDAFLRAYTGKSVDELSAPMSAVLGVSEAAAQPGIIPAKLVAGLPRAARYLSHLAEFATPVTVASPGAMMTGAAFNAGLRVLPALTDNDELKQIYNSYLDQDLPNKAGRDLTGREQARLNKYLQELLGKKDEMVEPELLAGGGAIRKAAEAIGAANKSTSSRPVDVQVGLNRAKSMVEQSGQRWDDVKQITTPEEYIQFQRRYGLASAVSERDDPTDVFNRGGSMFYDEETGKPVAYAPSSVGRKKPEGMAIGGLVYDADAINALANELMEPVRLAEGGPPRSRIAKAAAAVRELPDYLSPQEREFLNRDVITGQQVSERVPTGKNYAGDPYDPSLKIGVDVIRQMPEQMRKQADVMANYLNYPENAPRDPESVFRLLGDQGVENLLWLHDQMPEDVRRMSSYWYEGANKMAGEAAQRYGIPIEGTAGVYAALSPQMDWFKNVSLGNRLMDIMSTRQDQMFTPEMRRRGQELVDLPNAGFNPATAVVLDRIKDARLGDLKTPMEKAIWLRVFDEAHNPREYDIVDPMGNVMGLSLTNKGVPARVSWGGLKPIEKGISMFEDPSISNVTRKLGEMHKVRSFYNNIVDPYSGNSVTSDTHNVAAALLRPLSQSNIEVLHNMGSASSTDITGARGTYGFYADAVRRAAQERGLDTPREMQSITWEGVRGLYPPEMKRSALQKQKIDNAFNQYRRGQISGDQLRDMIGQEGGGIRLPAWYAR